MGHSKSLQESLDALKLSFDQTEEELYSDLTDEEMIELFMLDDEPIKIKLNLSKEERVRLKSGLDIFTYMQVETADTEETIMLPCRIVLDKTKRFPEYDSNETDENCIEFPDLIEYGSKYYMETHLLSDKSVKISKHELVSIKKFYDQFNFPETPEGQNDENDFFDELSELYQSPTKDESQELISKYQKYYKPTFN